VRSFGDKHDAEVDEALRSLCASLADLLNEFKKHQPLTHLQPARVHPVTASRLASSGLARSERMTRSGMPRIPWEALSQI